tara:strand:- start:1204 stop:2127 length:924 start_codon:yes stop_codon:yes gene_type:complete
VSVINPLISVIIPTFNRPSSLARAVKSVLTQTFGNLECIVVDDCSSIPASTILEKQLTYDTRLNVVRNSVNKHVSYSRNIGINLSKGEYIAFLDDDDYWYPEKLSLQLNTLLDTGTQVNYCWSRLIFSNNSYKYLKPNLSGNVFDLMLHTQPLCNCSTLLVSRHACHHLSGFNPSLKRGNDGDFIRRLSQYYHISLTPTVCVDYHVVTPGGNISTNNSLGYQRSIRSYKYRLAFFRNEFKSRPLKASYVYFMIGLSYCNLIKPFQALSYFYKTIELSFPVILEYLFIFTVAIFKFLSSSLCAILIKK